MITFNELTKISNKQIVDQFGSRAGNLVLLKNLEDLGFKVPDFACLPIELSASINSRIGVLSRTMKQSPNYFKASKMLEDKFWDHCPQYIRKNLFTLSKFCRDPLIIRGTSRLEGIEPLSFAGVCYSHLPKMLKEKDSSDIETGIKGVLAGTRTLYGYYYKNIHNLSSQMFDVGVIGMKMIYDAEYYGTIYTYDDHIGIRLMGNNLNIDHFYEKDYLAKNVKRAREIRLINWISTVCSKLKHNLNTKVGLDIEFLITKKDNQLCLWLVQVREVSSIHMSNYELSSLEETRDGHLINTVGEFSGRVAYFDENQSYTDTEDENVLFIVNHSNGNGTFEFLSSLSKKNHNKIGCIIIHSNEKHDHLQYSVFEDPRLSFVFHARNKIINLPEGSIVALSSDGFTLTY